ncbi:Ribulose-5-phosphate 4-epimerase/Fuculose-1-phosphate aldolase [Variovorax sp. HW608]|uniref:class II aldolase/adducin family protein n=1 Tax=Variovorax sp. HW608 TaxID=1034889 RepID=UPI00081FF54E|nr:class II aldolase/adducin family protein [Variovorax sp. HW608]SCK10136.1 Ribulose-5-phosphate 4-epimerase/Fuculose-1-phosphate aldolase [Variovorax sp. HW608]
MAVHPLNRESKPMSEAERKVRIDLAAAYRLVADFGMDDGIYTHISARVPGTQDQFLINPFGMLFKDITASSLVKIDIDGNTLEETPYEVNPAGFIIHSAVHSARHDAACVLHTHTVAGVAVSSLENGLEPCNQWALQFYHRVAYHEFEGLALDPAEKERLVADLGSSKQILILRNHGLLTLGRTVSEAFIHMKNLDRACRVQMAIQASGRPVHEVPAEICERTARQYEEWDSAQSSSVEQQYSREWNSLLKRIEPAASSSFRD